MIVLGALEMNELKTLILSYLRNHEDGTTFDISEEIGQEYHSVANALLRCRRQQLIGHTKVKGGPRNRLRKVYSLKPKGQARLEWYQQQARKAQEEKLPTTLEELAKIVKEPAKHKEMRKWTVSDQDLAKRKRAKE